jgi:hypothetical protein
MRSFHFIFYLSRDLNRIIEISCTKTYSSNETKAFHVEAYFSNNKQSTIKERQKKPKVPPGFEPRSPDSKSEVLTTTPWNLLFLFLLDKLYIF